MAVCKRCGEKIPNNSKFCTNCGTTTTTKVANKKINYDDVKIFSALSYVGILWIIGLFVKQKDDVNLKFHVGQGIILTITSVILNLITSILKMIVLSTFKVQEYVLVPKLFSVTWIGTVLSALISIISGLIIILFMIIGIKNALSNEQKELPIIGKYSFYK